MNLEKGIGAYLSDLSGLPGSLDGLLQARRSRLYPLLDRDRAGYRRTIYELL